MGGAIRPIRFLVFILIVAAPPLILSLLPSYTAGGMFGGAHGMDRDAFALFFNWVALPLLTFLLLYGRRVLGDMINRLNLVFGVRIPIERRLSETSILLRALEWITRPTTSRFLCAVGVGMLFAGFDYTGKLHAAQSLWLVSPVKEGTFFHFARLGHSQPNLAGLYADFVGNAVSTYLYFLLARLVVEFSLSSALIARHLKGRIMPAHPDRTGGLLPVGRVALVLSTPIFVVGVSVTVATLGEIFIWGHSPASTVYVWWGLYVLLCPVLFLLPVFPLRRLMHISKHAYLLKLEEMYHSFDSTEHVWSAREPVAPSRILDQFAVVQLIERVEQMSVWPFDKSTFMRFAGIVVGPLVPLLGSEPGELVRKLLKALFGIGA